MQLSDENGPISNINSELALKLDAARNEKNFAKMPSLRRLRGVVFAFLGLGLICQPMSIFFGWYVRMSYDAMVALELGITSYIAFGLYAIALGAQLTLSWLILWIYCRFLKQFQLNQIHQLQQTTAVLLPASRYQILFGALAGFIFPAGVFQSWESTLALAQGSLIAMTAVIGMYYLFRHYVHTAQGEIFELTAVTLQDASRGIYRTWAPKFALLMPVASIVLGIGFSFAPTMGWLKFPIPVTVLPSCTDPEVIAILERVVRSGPMGTRLMSIDGHRQLKFDHSEDVRYGECVVHIRVDDSRATLETQIKFVVEWMEREKRLFQVRVLPNEPPLCTESSVVKLLEQSMRSTPIGSTLKFIDGQRELRYDRDAAIRYGEFIAHCSDQDIAVKFVIELNQTLDMYEVRILPELPSCTDQDVENLIKKLVADLPVGTTLKSIEGHRELQYDQEQDIRYGECVAHTEAEDIKLKFAIVWQDHVKGIYQVQIQSEQN